jgi:hypothetical protein
LVSFPECIHRFKRDVYNREDGYTNGFNVQKPKICDNQTAIDELEDANLHGTLGIDLNKAAFNMKSPPEAFKELS